MITCKALFNIWRKHMGIETILDGKLLNKFELLRWLKIYFKLLLSCNFFTQANQCKKYKWGQPYTFDTSLIMTSFCTFRLLPKRRLAVPKEGSLFSENNGIKPVP